MQQGRRLMMAGFLDLTKTHFADHRPSLKNNLMQQK